MKLYIYIYIYISVFIQYSVFTQFFPRSEASVFFVLFCFFFVFFLDCFYRIQKAENEVVLSYPISDNKLWLSKALGLKS